MGIRDSKKRGFGTNRLFKGSNCFEGF